MKILKQLVTLVSSEMAEYPLGVRFMELNIFSILQFISVCVII